MKAAQIVEAVEAADASPGPEFESLHDVRDAKTLTKRPHNVSDFVNIITNAYFTPRGSLT